MNDAADPASLEAPQVLDIERSLERLEQDRAFLKEILTLFTVDGPARLERIETCLAQGDLPSAGKAAHSLKGMCGTIFAPALMDIALAMEKLCRNGDAGAAQELLPAMRRHMQAVLERIGEFVRAP